MSRTNVVRIDHTMESILIMIMIMIDYVIHRKACQQIEKRKP